MGKQGEEKRCLSASLSGLHLTKYKLCLSLESRDLAMGVEKRMWNGISLLPQCEAASTYSTVPTS